MEVIRQFAAIALTLALLAGSLWCKLRRQRSRPVGATRSGKVMEVNPESSLLSTPDTHCIWSGLPTG